MAGHKILVIDDSRVIRMRVKEMLPQGNFEVVEAKDGVEGLEMMLKERPNLIMLDFLLPRMNGWDVFQRIQSDPNLYSVPLVLMSGRKEEVTEKISEPFEFFEFIEKPFEQKELIGAIKGAMAKAKKPRPKPTAVAPAVADVASGGGDSAAEIAELKQKVAHLQAEVDGLKKQTAQILAFIKKKMQ